MAGWISQSLQLAVGAVLTAILVGLYRRWRVRRREAALREGRQTSFEAFIRGHVSPYPRRWQYGWVMVGLGPPEWKPRFGLVRRPVPLPASATVESIRRVSGFWEMLLTNPDCHVLVVRAGHIDLELAVMEIDVPTALQALESGTGGGWRVPSKAPVRSPLVEIAGINDGAKPA